MITRTTSLLVAVGLALGVTLGACNGTGDTRIKFTCKDYCAKAAECDDGVDEDDCVDNCRDDMEDCMSDEQEQALDDLDSCSEESCDDFLGCTIGAGLQCTFGI
jgi:hypothetical protein